jgi:hypothetical protein
MFLFVKYVEATVEFFMVYDLVVWYFYIFLNTFSVLIDTCLYVLYINYIWVMSVQMKIMKYFNLYHLCDTAYFPFFF